MGELRMQCAWCRRMYSDVTIDEPPLRLLLDSASHGMCPECLSRLLGRFIDDAQLAGDRLGALRAQRRRIGVLATFESRRASALRAAALEGQCRAKAIVDRSLSLLGAIRAESRGQSRRRGGQSATDVNESPSAGSPRKLTCAQPGGLPDHFDSYATRVFPEGLKKTFD
jgi:hypothetical protein